MGKGQKKQGRGGGTQKCTPRAVLPALAAIPVLILALAALLVLRGSPPDASAGTAAGQAAGTPPGTGAPGQPTEKWQEGTVSYNGQHYRYNAALKTYLFMGIDRPGPVEKAADSISGGQSDAMFLLVEDREAGEFSVVAINRNTMADVKVCDEEGDWAEGYQKMQICLQHGYGDGMYLSCSQSEEAVSRLFYGLPISGYFALNMDGIPVLNNLVGGVTVTVEQDLESPGLGVSLKEGETVTLSGEEAYVYLRARDTSEFDSATDRLRRQEQYLLGLFGKLGEQAPEELLDITDKISEYSVSSIDFARLAEAAEVCSLDAGRVYSVPGKAYMGTAYEEYLVDEAAFYEMILEIFYEPAQ